MCVINLNNLIDVSNFFVSCVGSDAFRLFVPSPSKLKKMQQHHRPFSQPFLHPPIPPQPHFSSSPPQ